MSESEKIFSIRRIFEQLNLPVKIQFDAAQDDIIITISEWHTLTENQKSIIKSVMPFGKQFSIPITLSRKFSSLGINVIEEIISFMLPIGRKIIVWNAGGKGDANTQLRLRNITDNMNIYVLIPTAPNGTFEGNGVMPLAIHGAFPMNKKISFQGINTSLIGIEDLSGWITITIE